MNHHCLDPEILDQLSTFTAEQLGLHFPRQRWRDLEKGLKAAALELGVTDGAALAQSLLSAPVTKDLLEVLASHITIGETYFFREKGIFEVLEWQILPQMLASRRSGDRQLRIWSAGCASGEEAYSIAMLLHKTLLDIQDWQITVLATDISQRALQKAERGVYTQWSFRGTPAWLAEKYFTRLKGDQWKIVPLIREMVTFSYLNLATDPFPARINNTQAMDIIFCRNVLMYFTPVVINRVVKNFSEALVEGGWLMVSPAECSLLQGSSLSACPQSGAIPYQKRHQADQNQISRFHGAAAGSKYPHLQTQTKVSTDFPVLVGMSKIQYPLHVSPLGSNEDGRIKERTFSNGACSAPQSIKLEKTAMHRNVYQGTDLPVLKETGGPSGNSNLTGLEEAAGLLGTGRYEEAAARVQRTMAEGDDDAGTMALLAKIYANQGKLAEARIWGEKAISQDRLNPRNYYLLASIFQEQNLGQEAITLLKQALYLDHGFVLAHFSLGNLAIRQQRYSEAEKHFDNVLVLMARLPDEEIIPASQGVTTEVLREMVLTIKHRLTKKQQV